MRKIKLTKGKYTIVDDENFNWLNKYNWHITWNGYVFRNNHKRIATNRYTNKRILMHREINKTPDGLFTDHINRNKLDNRKCNLRTADKSINGLNVDKPKDNKSGYKGVYFEKWSNKWRAELKVNGKKFSLGRFVNIREAIKTRLIGEQKYAIPTFNLYSCKAGRIS